MAAGKLVISTSTGMQGIDQAMHGIHFLKAEEKNDFITQINWALENKEQAELIAKAGSAMVRKEYDQKKIMSRLINKMNALLGT